MADSPRVAVLSLTRDRLAYTKHCFGTLRELAGCPFDHFVLDQGSQDDTQNWLFEHAGDFEFVEMLPANIGVSRGLNALLAHASGYDVYVKFDNDCELTKPGTLKVAAELVHNNPKWIVSPKIEGLDSPPATAQTVDVDGTRVGVLGLIGGIFMAVPGSVFNGGWRYSESNPVWGMDDATLGSYFTGQGGKLGYLLDFPANHLHTTRGQWADPEQTAYYARKAAEFGH